MTRSTKNIIQMPRYTHARKLKSGNFAYYWQLPTWAKKQGCTIANEALGANMPKAMARAEFLNNMFDDWKEGRDIEGKQVIVGTFDWLTSEYQQHRMFRETSPATQTNNRRLMSLACNHKLNNGTRLGAIKLSDISPDNADEIYERILHRIEGSTTTKSDQPRYREAQGVVVILKTAWNRMRRKYPQIIGIINPFADLNTSYEPQHTYKSTSADLSKFETTAIELGYLSIAAIARIQFDFYMRPDNIIKYLEWDHYEEGKSLWIKHNKNKRPIEFLLYDEDGTQLYPETENILRQLPRNGKLMITREFYKNKPAERYIPYTVREMQEVAKKVRIAAGLPDHVTLTTFRHGGIQDGSDSAGTDQELLSSTGHKSRKMLNRYTDHTVEQRRKLGKKRRTAKEANKTKHQTEQNNEV